MRTFVRVNLSRIVANYHRLRAACPPGGEVLAIVKANAYGHGALDTVNALESAGCSRFAVACLSEGAELRVAGIRGEIVVLDGFLPGEERDFVARQLTPVLHASHQVASWIEQGRHNSGDALRCHLKVNTGLNRLGVSMSEAPALAAALAAAPGVSLEGVATHLASAEDFEDPAADEQLERFRQLLAELDRLGLSRPRWIHFANSAGLAFRPPLGNLARCGLALYGWLPKTAGDCPTPRVEVLPALEWRARVMAVNALGRGARIGYGGAFTVEAPMRVAALAVGYGDGYRRELSRGGRVRLHGRDCPVVGRVSMDITMIDVSACERVAPGDEAIVLGDGVTAHELADLCGTIAYEILCGIAARVPRVPV